MDIFWLTIMILALLLFVALHVVVLPRRFLRCTYTEHMTDRGVKNINEENGHSIVYEPAMKYRKYLKHYLISHRGDEVKLACDFDKNVRYADFDVSLYNELGQVFKVLHARQAVDNGDSEPIKLPAETAYVSVKLNQINNTVMRENRVRGVAYKKVFIFLAICSVIEIVAIFIMRIGLGKLLGSVFADNFIESKMGNLVTLIAALVFVFLNNLLTIIAVQESNKRQAARE